MDKNIDFNGLIGEVGKCCLSEESCGTCEKGTCLVGYCKQSLLTAFKQKDEFIDNGMDDIPYEDTKLYDDEKIINSIGFILNQCKNCQLYHDEDCIINIIRCSMEVALLGDHIDYKGSTLMYFSDLGNKNKEISQKIYSAFKQVNK
ncbi:hypothetical protein [Alkaliphilus sp. B6464]|uniref:hypothetical protein n=1 Tax=Alkaliphilus sp. B6464 TaxID=2731219 RepID=UPI001BA54B8F|nr:hypothetical protein [Alkaliphilus sp. B6464]QUH19012.1 hypothetical protein HYG84_03360 [Alkaliphilus sp. B6464]